VVQVFEQLFQAYEQKLPVRGLKEFDANVRFSAPSLAIYPSPVPLQSLSTPVPLQSLLKASHNLSRSAPH